MSGPIDLDLVELRCKLRGWTCERTFSGHYGESSQWTYALEIMTPDGHIYARDDGEYGGDDASTEKHEHIITRPRLTLSDIVASPPEGWRVLRSRHYSAGPDRVVTPHLGWGPGDNPETIVRIVVLPRSIDLETVRWARPCTLDRLAERHRAVAELLVLLGEVEG